MRILSNQEQKSITQNIIEACKDISKLSQKGYKWISLCSGFIAHYNLHGFKAEYDPKNNNGQPLLANSILMNQRNNQWGNFLPNDKDYEYMMQKKKMYNDICKALKDDGHHVGFQFDLFGDSFIR